MAEKITCEENRVVVGGLDMFVITPHPTWKGSSLEQANQFAKLFTQYVAEMVDWEKFQKYVKEKETKVKNVKKVLIVKNNQKTQIFAATTEEEKEAAAKKVIRQRLNDGYYNRANAGYYHKIELAKAALKNGSWDFVIHESSVVDFDFQKVEWVEVESPEYLVECKLNSAAGIDDDFWRYRFRYCLPAMYSSFEAEKNRMNKYIIEVRWIVSSKKEAEKLRRSIFGLLQKEERCEPMVVKFEKYSVTYDIYDCAEKASNYLGV